MNEAERIADAKRAGFYPLMILLERLQRDRAPVGSPGSPDDEGVRFRHAPEFAFSPGDVLALERRVVPQAPDSLDPDREILEVTTTFLGLTGPVSPLPSYFTEELLQDDAESAPRRDFLDIFHHRLLSLLYRAQARYDMPNGWLSDGSDPWARRLLALLGLDDVGSASGRLPPWRILRLSGLLADGEVTAGALEVALADVLGPDLGDAGVSVEQFVGTWAEVEPSQLTRLGRVAIQLGRDFLLGRSVFDRAGKFRVVVGPLSRQGYARFTEGSQSLRRIALLISTILPGALEYEVILWLRREAAPALELTSSGRTRLGKNSWLGGQSREARIPATI